MISEGVYKKIAWDDMNQKRAETDWMLESIDMKDIDTSNYEDKMLSGLNNYKKQKGKVKYNIFPSYIVIYEILDENIISKNSDNSITVDLVNHIEDVAMYNYSCT